MPDAAERRSRSRFALPAPPAPTITDNPAAPPAIDPEMEEELEKKAKGRAATILTSGKGLLGGAPTAMKTLLGA
jgi:hypothetical protein